MTRKDLLGMVVGVACFMGIVLFTVHTSHAEPHRSAHFTICSNVVGGGGGGQMVSANYQTLSTLAQPSPLNTDGAPAQSAGYSLYPGYWYIAEYCALRRSKAMPWLLLLLGD